MVRALLRFILVVVIVVAAAAFFFGYRWGGTHFRNIVTSSPAPSAQTAPTGTTGGAAETARERARAAGAEIGDKVAAGAARAAETLDEAKLTAKVKSKIALDDTLDGSHIQVSTQDQQVTLDGTVVNEAQHQRALSLARETEGVTRVVDQLSIGR